MVRYKHPDLHMHTSKSDGTDEPLALLEKVRASDIDFFAVTDHDEYVGCREIADSLAENPQEGDPRFIWGTELSCKDDEGSYHILGYCYNMDKSSIRETMKKTKESRQIKAQNRIRFLEESGYHLAESDIEKIFSEENPGKPHFVDLLLEKGYVETEAEGYDLMKQYKGNDFKLSPEAAIDGILEADGIPVLAHGIKGTGSANFSEEEIRARVARLKAAGLMGLECYYSSFTEEQTRIMLALAEEFNLLVTAGSDYHGLKKTVAMGDSGNPDPKKLERFFRLVEMK